MMGTILIIVAFQAYWLKNNYDREKRTLQQKTNIAFRETVMQLQSENLKLSDVFNDSLNHFNIGISSKIPLPVKAPLKPPESVITMVNAIGDKIKDSLKKSQKINSRVFISSATRDYFETRDSARGIKLFNGSRTEDWIIHFLYSVDSLQDSLKLSVLDSAFTEKLKSEKLEVPFFISKTHPDSVDQEVWKPHPQSDRRTSEFIKGAPVINKITVGLLRPVTYELTLGNTFPYLVKRIASPILFSLFLVGATILSFVVLYRNLLKQRRLTELKNDFISNITHELKTPIATVGVAIEALQNFNALNNPERTKEYLDISKNELHRLSMLVDKVLKLSMFENHELELRKEDFDLKEVVNEVAASFRLQMEKRNAVCHIYTSGDNFFITADRMHLTSVLYNLIDNALKYSGEAPVINVELENKPGHIILRVKDNGTGIPPEYKSKVFEKFFRVPSGNMHNVKGYGLGLSYVAHVIARHQGTVSVESEPGKGSTFIIHLPVASGY